ncbi:MAG: SAM-dependent methyltransferase [Gemmatimonadetes bacterium]|nr:SAM-dependent methyltransferase [Gemmatimonadota bacterium]
MDQAESVSDLIHHDTEFPPDSRILEVACGVGAQTVAMAQRLPACHFVSFDKIPQSVGLAAERVRTAGLQEVHLLTADLFEAPFKPESFDVLFVSYLLEHLPDPLAALISLKTLLRPGGTLLVVEGDHGSCYFHPDTPEAIRAWKCLIEVQAGLGCDSEIGRRLHPLLQSAGFENVRVSPRMVYADKSRPLMQHQFVLQTIVPMVEGIRIEALTKNLMSPIEWEKGVADLRETGLSSKGTFCYTFFKASAKKCD